jgi:two-component system, cell cycle sensor histidine kinase and response regulator CckA
MMHIDAKSSLFERKYNLLVASIFFASAFWIFEAYRHYIDSGTITFTAEIFHPTGHELWMRSVIVFLFVTYGVIVQALFNKFKNAEKATRQAYFELDQIFQTSADGMRVIDSDFNITRVNKTLLAMANQSRATDVVGEKCYEIFSGSKCHTVDCPIVQITEGKTRVEYETIKRSKDGSQTTCIVTATPFYDSDQRLLGIVEDFKDISDRKKAEQEKFELLADLRQSQKMEAIGTLAGGIAHDFNNILSAIFGFAELAKRDIEKGLKPIDDLNEIIKSAHRAKELIQQILTYSRKESHKLEPLLPQAIIEESLKLLRATLPANIGIKEYVENQKNFILADPTKIQQIIINLCTNALHTMEESGGVLTIKLAHNNLVERDLPLNSKALPGQFLKLTVQDTGCGIEEKAINRIFDPYFTTKKIGKGTGLGLSVIDGIVKDYKGFIVVESTPGEGSSFHLYFPTLQVETSIISNSIPPQNQDLFSSTDKHILIVDDEPLLVKINQRRLESLGYKVSTTTDSNAALEKIKDPNEKYDLIITDQTMPGLTGKDLAQEVLKLYPDMPMVMCTGHSDIISEEAALDLGIKKYIFKPIQGDELINAVGTLLNDNEGTEPRNVINIQNF